MKTRFATAYDWMLDLIDCGQDTATAHDKAVWRFDLNATDANQLLELYDNEEGRTVCKQTNNYD